MRTLTTRIIAFLLLLTFTQKLGVQLLMHNRLHTAQLAQSSNASGSSIKMQCDCVDEALMPLSTASIAPIAAPVVEAIVIENIHQVHFSFRDKLFCSLKAPPVI